MPNGVIIDYIITITGSILGVPPVPGNTTTFEVMGLDPGAQVVFTVSARTSAGQGPVASITVDLPGRPAHTS